MASEADQCSAGMRCNLCGFSLPSPDLASVALMQQHLWQEHGVERFRPLPRSPKCAEEPW